MDLLAPLPSKTISVEIVELVGTGRFIALATSNTDKQKIPSQNPLSKDRGFFLLYILTSTLVDIFRR
jgi:hypothetical protein